MKKRSLLNIAIVFLIVLFLFIALKIKKVNLLTPQSQNIALTASGLLAQAKDLEAKGNLSEAQAMYQRLINEFSNSEQVLSWQKKMEELNIKLLFSSAITPKSVFYEIKPGDTLAKIAKEFKTTPGLIKKSNNLSDDKILPQRRIKVWAAPFSIVVDKSQNTLILKADEEVIKTYIVSTGINNSTPVGNFKIASRIPNPTWYKPGAVIPADSPKNILGSRWLGFNLPGYGIHGTTEPQTLGKQVTQGCVRMSNADVEELYTIVPEGTEVTVVD